MAEALKSEHPWLAEIDRLAGIVGRMLDRAATARPSTSAAGRQADAARSCYRMARSHLGRGDREAAIDQLMTAVEIDDWYVDTYHALAAVYYDWGQLQKALWCYQELMWRCERHPDRAHVDLAIVEQSLRRIHELRKQGVTVPA